MQLEEKLVEDRESAHAELQQREDLEVRDAQLLPEPVAEALVETGVERRAELLGAVRMLLAGEPLNVNLLRIPKREAHALEALQAAVQGRGLRGEFVYAEDRRDLLEQALAVLQPDLSRADDQSARELQAQLSDMSERVVELRATLSDLEDAQDEIVEFHQAAALGKGDTEPSDKPKPKPTPTPSDPDAPRPATTLVGPDRPEPAKQPTTLTGPELREPARPTTTLVGPDRADAAKPPSTLTGPERAAPPAPPSTLVGPERDDEPRPASSLGSDPAPAGDKAKRPWWKRPFG
jgi:hypothetical protein